MSYLKISLLSFIISSCATHLPGTQGVSELPKSEGRAPLEVSLERIPGLSSESYQAFLVSFKNNGEEWIRIDSNRLTTPYVDYEFKFLLGSDLDVYMNSVARRNSIDRHNTAVALGLLSIAGGAAAALSENPRIAGAGAGIMAGSLSYSVIEEIKRSGRRAELQGYLPQNHILQPTSIPPHLSTTRIFVTEMKQDFAYKFIDLLVTKKDGSTAKFSFTDSEYERKFVDQFKLLRRKDRQSHKQYPTFLSFYKAMVEKEARSERSETH